MGRVATDTRGPLGAPRLRPENPPERELGPYGIVPLIPQRGQVMNPREIGRHDRDPFPTNPFAPPPLFGEPGDLDDGMLLGPHHPIFGRREHVRPWGGDGYLPPLGAPPGARFDPIATLGGPRRNPQRGLPVGTGEPDADEFMPPSLGGSVSGALREGAHMTAFAARQHVYVSLGCRLRKIAKQ